MTARDEERELLRRCLQVARGGGEDVAHDRREANVFRVAASVLRSSFPAESRALKQASDRYLGEFPGDEIDPGEVVRCGWVVSLPRLREMLTFELRKD